jgi:hypothetical protein
VDARKQKRVTLLAHEPEELIAMDPPCEAQAISDSAATRDAAESRFIPSISEYHEPPAGREGKRSKREGDPFQGKQVSRKDRASSFRSLALPQGEYVVQHHVGKDLNLLPQLGWKPRLGLAILDEDQGCPPPSHPCQRIEIPSGHLSSGAKDLVNSPAQPHRGHKSPRRPNSSPDGTVDEGDVSRQ